MIGMKGVTADEEKKEKKDNNMIALNNSRKNVYQMSVVDLNCKHFFGGFFTECSNDIFFIL